MPPAYRIKAVQSYEIAQLFLVLALFLMDLIYISLMLIFNDLYFLKNLLSVSSVSLNR